LSQPVAEPRLFSASMSSQAQSALQMMSQADLLAKVTELEQKRSDETAIYKQHRRKMEERFSELRAAFEKSRSRSETEVRQMRKQLADKDQQIHHTLVHNQRHKQNMQRRIQDLQEEIHVLRAMRIENGQSDRDWTRVLRDLEKMRERFVEKSNGEWEEHSMKVNTDHQQELRSLKETNCELERENLDLQAKMSQMECNLSNDWELECDTERQARERAERHSEVLQSKLDEAEGVVKELRKQNRTVLGLPSEIYEAKPLLMEMLGLMRAGALPSSDAAIREARASVSGKRRRVDSTN